MMEQLAGEVRTLVYVIICFQCLLQLTSGSAYQRYLKLFAYLLTLCVCCNVLMSVAGQIEEGWLQAEEFYEEWLEKWQSVQEIEPGSLEEYDGLLEERIVKEAQEEFDRRENNNEGSYTEVPRSGEELSGKSETGR